MDRAVAMVMNAEERAQEHAEEYGDPELAVVPKPAEKEKAPVDPERLRADGFEMNGFKFPEPDPILMMGLTAAFGSLDELPSGVQITAGVGHMAWFLWCIETDHKTRIYHYALDGKLPEKQAIAALEKMVPTDRFMEFATACGGYMEWVREHFMPEPEEEGGEPTGKSTSG